MFAKHELVAGLWVLTDNTPDAGWESLVCENKTSKRDGDAPNYGKARWDLSRRYDAEQDAINGHAAIVEALGVTP